MKSCCLQIKKAVEDKRIRLRYTARFRRFCLTFCYKSCVIPFYYCLWCGKKLPSLLKEEFYAVLNNEYGMDGYDYESELPEEMKSDEWWKKRGL